MKNNKENNKEGIWEILETYGYPDKPGLDFTNEFTCLVASVLSARTRDSFLNTQTPDLFKDAPDAQRMYELGVDGIGYYIKRIGLWHSKAKYVFKLSKQILELQKIKKNGGEKEWYDNLCEKYGNEDDKMGDMHLFGPIISKSGIPSFRLGLLQLSGVGRKTANVFLNHQYDAPVFPVDAHVRRLGMRIGIFDENNPIKMEEILHDTVPEKYAKVACTMLVWHGRRVCISRPKCSICKLRNICNYGLALGRKKSKL